MKKLFLILIFVIEVFHCFAQENIYQRFLKKEASEREEIISRNIHKIIEWNYSIEDKGDTVFTGKNIEIFDRKGRVMEKSYFDVQGTLKAKSSFTYDTENKILVSKYFNFKIPYELHTDYEYKKNKIISLSYNGNVLSTKNIQKFDSKNDIILTETYTGKDELVFTSEKKIDKDGNSFKVISSLKSGELSHRETRKYTEGLLIEKNTFVQASNTETRTEYQYDDENFLIEFREYKNNLPSLIVKVKYELRK